MRAVGLIAAAVVLLPFAVLAMALVMYVLDAWLRFVFDGEWRGRRIWRGLLR